jgi:hypothetical protein
MDLRVGNDQSARLTTRAPCPSDVSDDEWVLLHPSIGLITAPAFPRALVA